MGSLPSEFPISLRAQPSSSDPNSLETIIKRINTERGGFLNLTEESLREEIAESENEGEDENGSSEEDEDGEPDRAKELVAAREEIIGQIEQAHQSALFALDFISLLLSKDTPVQASLSMSPALRELVGTGTLGADKLHAPKISAAEKQDNKQIAKGWKLQSLNKTVDSILASATRLEKEIELETKYWEQVLAVNEKGWAVCRLPNEKHILGVRFGFSEASPAFRNRSLAALRRNPDGTISLDQGMGTTEPQCLRVRVRVGNTITGTSRIPKPAAEDAPVEALILQARNTIFSEELWQELNREARTLVSMGAQSSEDTITCPLTATKSVVLDLVPLEDSTSSPGADDAIAEAVLLSLHLLLSYSHRQNHRRRCQPPPPIASQKRTPAPYTLLRALLARLKHQETITDVDSLLRPLCNALKSASLNPTYSIKSNPFNPTAQITTAERTVASLTERLESMATFSISDSISITIVARTAQMPVCSTFLLSLNDSILQKICPPPSFLTSYPALRDYIYYATSCALAVSLAPLPTLDTDYLSESWVRAAQPNAAKKFFPTARKSKQLTISVRPLGAKTPFVSAKQSTAPGVRVRVIWEWMRGEATGKEEIEYAMDSSTNDFNRVWAKEKELPDKRIKGEGMYEWIGFDRDAGAGAEWEDGEGIVIKSFEEVVENAGK